METSLAPRRGVDTHVIYLQIHWRHGLWRHSACLRLLENRQRELRLEWRSQLIQHRESRDFDLIEVDDNPVVRDERPMRVPVARQVDWRLLIVAPELPRGSVAKMNGVVMANPVAAVPL